MSYERDLLLVYERRAITPESTALIKAAIDKVQAHIDAQSGKKNKRRERDQRKFALTIEAVISDISYRYFQDFEKGLIVTRSNRLLGKSTRYRPKVFSKKLPEYLDNLSHPDVGLIEQSKANRYKAKATSLMPTQTLVELLREHEVDDQDHFGVDKTPEPLVLKSKTDDDDYWDVAINVDYPETKLTMQLREELEAINGWIESANISYKPTPYCQNPNAVDTDVRSLRRIFTNAKFQSGGRLYDGFWQGMTKDSRIKGLTIASEPVVELDYGQAGSRILYGIAGASPPATDHYLIEGFEDRRDGIKKVMSSMIFASKQLSKFPRGTRDLFSGKSNIEQVMSAIEEHHPAIKHLFFKGVGHQVQYVESTILVDVLTKLKGLGIVALPIHDAVLVPKSSTKIAINTMHKSFEEFANVPAKVSTYVGP